MTDCAAPRHDGQDEPTPCEPAAYLCKPCRFGLVTDLRRLPRLHAELRNIPPRAEGDGSGLPFSDPAWECRDQIRHDLAWWARQITKERGAAAPPAHGDAWSSRPVYVLAGWLAGQAAPPRPWVPFRPWAPEMAGAINANYGRAKALLDPWVTKRFAIPGQDGLCVSCDSGDPVTCEDCGEAFTGIPAFVAHFAKDNHDRLWCELPALMGLARSPSGHWGSRVMVTVYASDGDRRRSFIGCPGCGQQWEPEQWLAYGHKVVKRREAMAS